MGIPWKRPDPSSRIEAEGVAHVLPKPPVAVNVSGFMPNYVELTVHFWVDTDRGPGLLQIRTAVMEACLVGLKRGGFTLSADVTTAVSLRPVDVALQEPDPEVRNSGERSRAEEGGQDP
jgi:hypothetical protein